MKIFSKLPLLFFLGIASIPGAFANIYRIDLNYGSDPDPTENAGLSGFMIINTALDTGGQRNTSLGNVAIPNWITSISLTYDPTPNSPSSGDEETTTSFDRITWTLSNPPNFDITADFMDLDGNAGTDDPQFSQLGFLRFTGTPSFGYENEVALRQQTRGGEFPLQSTTTTPGGLPLLGLGTLAFYYKKLKTKNFKL